MNAQLGKSLSVETMPLPGLDVLGRLKARRLTVEAGAHRGADVTLDLEEIAIGSDLSNDLVLMADDLAPRHVTVASTNILFGTARVTAENGPVTIEDGRRLEPGQWLEVKLPTRLGLGAATVAIEPEIDLAKAAKFVLLGALLLCMVFIGFKTTSAMMQGRGEMGGIIASVRAAAVTTVADPEARDAATLALRNRLAVAGLAERITLEQVEDGTVIASGQILPAEAERWRDVLRWLDVQPSAPLLVNNVTKNAPDAAMPAFRSVWMGANPSVLLQNGRMAVPGDEIGDGWKLVEIGKDGVIVERDGRTVKVAY
ncbi:MAG: hypothetical protein R3D02_08990 [Hyphomicrobiales bacterium]